MLRAVLDANVYESAYVRPEGPPGQIVERFLRAAAFEVILSTAVVDEALRALAYPPSRCALRRAEPNGPGLSGTTQAATPPQTQKT